MYNYNGIIFYNRNLSASGGLAFKVKNTKSYTDAYNEIKPQLEEKAVIDFLIKSHNLVSELFNGDTSYIFLKTYYNWGLYYKFINQKGDTKLYYIHQTSFIYIN